ncbi:MAG: hypothetical protein WDN44_06240 [Sphingomonas sp.]
MPAREAIGGAMRVTFVPDPDRPFGAATSVLGFQLDFGHAPLRTAPVSAHLRGRRAAQCNRARGPGRRRIGDARGGRAPCARTWRRD